MGMPMTCRLSYIRDQYKWKTYLADITTILLEKVSSDENNNKIETERIYNTEETE